MPRHLLLILISFFLCCQPIFGTAEVSSSDTSKWFDDYSQPIGFTYKAGFDIVSSYIWRGFEVGGLSFQPDLAVGYGGLSIGTWWNLGAESNCFRRFLPEVDTYLQFSRYGVTLRLTHMYYFDGSGFFDFSQKDIYGAGNTNNFELKLAYRVSDRLPLLIEWYTHLAGSDGYVVDRSGDFVAAHMNPGDETADLRIKRAFSTYIQLGYEFKLPYDIYLPLQVGVTPWKSRYTHYQGHFAVCRISLGAEKTFPLSFCQLHLFATAVFNPDRVNSNNFIVPLHLRDRTNNDTNTHLSAVIGVGMWF